MEGVKRAIIFPGQGSQYVGMGYDFFEEFPQAKEIFHEADEILGFSISSFCFSGPEEKLKDTEIQQLAIVVTSIAIFEVFKEKFKDIKNFSYFSGLSLGEYTALYASGVLDFKDTLILVKERAKAMQKASRINPSSMLAIIGVKEEDLKKEKNSDFYISNLNSPQQVVISVSKDKKEEVRKKMQEKGRKVVELKVSGGFHSPFMEPAKKDLEKIIEKLTFKQAHPPIVSNFLAKPVKEPFLIKESLLNQLTHPVLWQRCIEFMVEEGVKVFFEVGPSRILRGLIKKINPQIKVVNIEKVKDLEGGGNEFGF